MKIDNRKKLREIIKPEIIKRGILKVRYIFTEDEFKKLTNSIAKEIIKYQKKLKNEKR
ncbi:MAG: hypothetical protein AABY84_12135 [Candidatus Firestonebacteria bacterium]